MAFSLVSSTTTIEVPIERVRTESTVPLMEVLTAKPLISHLASLVVKLDRFFLSSFFIIDRS